MLHGARHKGAGRKLLRRLERQGETAAIRAARAERQAMEWNHAAQRHEPKKPIREAWAQSLGGFVTMRTAERRANREPQATVRNRNR